MFCIIIDVNVMKVPNRFIGCAAIGTIEATSVEVGELGTKRKGHDLHDTEQLLLLGKCHHFNSKL